MTDHPTFGNLAVVKQDVTSSVLRFLVLDDCTFDRRRLRRIMRDVQTVCAVEWFEVASLDAFMDVVETVTFDLIFIDYYLPVGNGGFALEFLQQTELNANSPVLLVTGGLNVPLDIDRADLSGVLHKGGMGFSQVSLAVEKALTPRSSIPAMQCKTLSLPTDFIFARDKNTDLQKIAKKE